MFRLILFSLLITSFESTFSKPPKEKTVAQIKTEKQSTYNITQINDACLLNIQDSSYLFTTTSKGIYLAGTSQQLLEKGNFGAISATQIQKSDTIYVAVAGKKYNTIQIFQFIPKDRSLKLMSASEIPSGVDEISQMVITQDSKLYILGKRGGFEIMDIFRLSWGELDAKIIYSGYLPEKPKDFTADKNTIWGTYEKGGFWKIDIITNNGIYDISYPEKFQLKKNKTPFFAIESFYYKNQQFLILNDKTNDTFIFYNVSTKKYSSQFKISFSPKNSILKGGNIILGSQQLLYILDDQEINEDGSNFKIIDIQQLSSILDPLLP